MEITNTMIRIAAIADLHVRVGDRDKWTAQFQGVQEWADVLLLPGDLTDNGTLEEGKVLAEALKGLDLPIFAVLGNHDYLDGHQRGLCDMLADHSIKVLDGESAVVRVGNMTLGIVGLRGFRGGYDPLLIMDGSLEPEIAAWRDIIKQEVGKL